MSEGGQGRGEGARVSAQTLRVAGDRGPSRSREASAHPQRTARCPGPSKSPERLQQLALLWTRLGAGSWRPLSSSSTPGPGPVKQGFKPDLTPSPPGGWGALVHGPPPGPFNRGPGPLGAQGDVMRGPGGLTALLLVTLPALFQARLPLPWALPNRRRERPSVPGGQLCPAPPAAGPFGAVDPFEIQKRRPGWLAPHPSSH